MSFIDTLQQSLATFHFPAGNVYSDWMFDVAYMMMRYIVS